MKNSIKALNFCLILLSVSIISNGLINTQASALSGNEFNAGRIIDDTLFYNGDTMDVGQIQSFLNSKVSTCDTWGTQIYSGSQTRAQYGASRGYPAPYTCLKDYRQDTGYKAGASGLCSAIEAKSNRSAAEIIDDVARACHISEKVIVVMLQKEQGLVTDDWPWSLQYRGAMGYGCPDTAPCDAEYYGFFNQVYNAALQFQRYKADPTNWNHVPFMNNQVAYQANAPSCGSRTTYIENYATAGLYNYTPYTPNGPALNNLYGTGDACSAYGNRNFWRYYNDWFGKTNGSNIVRTPSNPTYYLLTNGKKFAIPSGDILYAYGLERTPLEVVSDQFLSSIADGGMLSTLFTIPGNQTVFLADGNKKYGIASGEYCTRWGLACGNADIQKEIGLEIFNQMVDGGVLQPIMRHASANYLMENGQKRNFLSDKAVTDNGYSNASTTTVINWTNAIRPAGFSLLENGSFVKFGSSSAIYAYASSNFYTIPDYETYKNWYSSQTPSHYDSQSQYNSQPPVAVGSLNNIVVDGSNKKYLIDGGRRVEVTNVTNDWPAGISSTPLSVLVNRLPVTATITSPQTSLRQSDGGIYTVAASTKRPFNSLRDYFDLGYGNLPHLQLVTNNLSLSVGSTLFAESSAYKVQGSDAIYMVGKNSTTHALLNLSQIHTYRINTVIPTITPSNAAQFTHQGLLYSLSINDSGRYHVATQKGMVHLSTEDIARWGVDTSNAVPLGQVTLARIPSAPHATTFFAGPNGTIFKGENGTKRPIGSFSTYRSLGGNDTNTSSVPQDLLDTMPSGTLYP